MSEYRACRPPDSFVEQVADHVLLVEQDVSLHGVVEACRESSGSGGLWSWPLPQATDLARVNDLLHQVQGLFGCPCMLEDVLHAFRAMVPEAYVQATEGESHNCFIA